MWPSVDRGRRTYIKAPTSAINSIILKCTPEVYVVRREDLIISKIAWAKECHPEVQKRDVQNLLATGYDERYLERWLE